MNLSALLVKTGFRLVALGALLAAGCLRDLPELPPAQEGVEVTGQAFSLDPATGNQAPVEGALVRVVGTGRTATTDREGRFSIGGLPLGRYDVSLQGQKGSRFGLRPTYRLRWTALRSIWGFLSWGYRVH